MGPDGVPLPLAEHHHTYWQWLWALRRGVSSRPFVAVWSRGHGKSTSTELGVVAVGARNTRRFALYVSGTQEQANDHVQSIASAMENRSLAVHYPAFADRAVGRYGRVRGWRRDRLMTASGFVVDALGLDVAARGIKVDEVRPDIIVLDDVDDTGDGAGVIHNKERAIGRKILPAGSRDVAVVFVQNLIHPDSVMSRVLSRKSDLLAERTVSGPHPALRAMEWGYEDGHAVITAGVPTWAGQSLADCQELVRHRLGITDFLAEYQHEVALNLDGHFSKVVFRRCDPEDVPWDHMRRVMVAVDPAVSDTDASDAHGVQVDGITDNGDVYRLASWEERASPAQALTVAYVWAVEYGAEALLIETNQGGDLWRTEATVAWQTLCKLHPHYALRDRPRILSVKATRATGSKVARATGELLSAYEHGRFVHVRGTHQVLEAALLRFGVRKPFDLVDAGYWSYRALLRSPERPTEQWAEVSW